MNSNAIERVKRLFGSLTSTKALKNAGVTASDERLLIWAMQRLGAHARGEDPKGKVNGNFDGRRGNRAVDAADLLDRIVSAAPNDNARNRNGNDVAWAKRVLKNAFPQTDGAARVVNFSGAIADADVSPGDYDLANWMLQKLYIYAKNASTPSKARAKLNPDPRGPREAHMWSERDRRARQARLAIALIDRLLPANARNTSAAAAAAWAKRVLRETFIKPILSRPPRPLPGKSGSPSPQSALERHEGLLRAARTPEDLKKAYRTAVLALHPNKRPPNDANLAAENFKRISNVHSRIRASHGW